MRTRTATATRAPTVTRSPDVPCRCERWWTCHRDRRPGACSAARASAWPAATRVARRAVQMLCAARTHRAQRDHVECLSRLAYASCSARFASRAPGPRAPQHAACKQRPRSTTQRHGVPNKNRSAQIAPQAPLRGMSGRSAQHNAVLCVARARVPRFDARATHKSGVMLTGPRSAPFPRRV